MNERIRQLAIEAGFYVADDKIYTPLSREEITKYQEKFAELLVRECALQCVHNEDMDLIEKHFGVDI